jgi:hypothetical protein
MGLKLNDKCKKRLVEVTADALTRFTLNAGYWPMSSSNVEAGDKALDVRGPASAVLEWIGEPPFSLFVTHSITKRLLRSGVRPNHETSTVPLTSLEAFKDTTRVALELVDEFDSLPFACVFTASFSEQLAISLQDAPGAICKTLAIIGEEEREAKFASIDLYKRDPNLLASLTRGPRMYVQVYLEGFFGANGELATESSALGLIKSFYGLLVAVGAAKVARGSLFTGIPAILAFPHERRGEYWLSVGAHTLPHPTAETIERMEPQVEPAHLLAAINRLGPIFERPARGRKILLAAEWLFNSYEGHDELLQYVQATVALEILFGDKARSDVLGLTELLRNRCAYLIGSTPSERDEILETFGKIYSVRSGIVHAGKRRLSKEDRRLFSCLRTYCHRAVSRELELLELEVHRHAPNGSASKSTRSPSGA